MHYTTIKMLVQM